VSDTPRHDAGGSRCGRGKDIGHAPGEDAGRGLCEDAGRGLCEDAGAYALGALEPTEAEAFRRHLQTCVACREELASLRQTTDALALGVPRFQTPPQLRRRVLAAVRAEARERTRPDGRGRARLRRALGARPALPRRATVLVAAVLAAAAVFAGALAAGGGPSGRVISARVIGISGQAKVRIVGAHAQLLVHDLPDPGAGHIYEVWLQRGTSTPQPSSLFGRGSEQVDVDGNMRGVRRLLVTREPTPGTRTPTARPLIIAAL